MISDNNKLPLYIQLYNQFMLQGFKWQNLSTDNFCMFVLGRGFDTITLQGKLKLPQISKTLLSLTLFYSVSLRFLFPWWFQFIAYFLCLATCGVSFWVCVQMGGVFGSEKSNKWMISFVTSFFESLLLSQPIKVRRGA